MEVYYCHTSKNVECSALRYNEKLLSNVRVFYSGCQKARLRPPYINRLKMEKRSCLSCISPLRIHTGSRPKRAQCLSAI